MHALHELVQQGLVRYIGMSSCYAWECQSRLGAYLIVYSLMMLSLRSPLHAECVDKRPLLFGGTDHRDRVDYAITHGLTPFISMQDHHSLIYREEEREMFPTLKVNSHALSGKRPLRWQFAALRRFCHSLVGSWPRFALQTIQKPEGLQAH